jgi:hypothetical protein
MTEIDAIAVQHEGWPHAPQECWVGDFPCDVQTLLAEIATLRAALDGLVEAASAGCFGFCDRTDRREACNLPDCAACNFRVALAAAKETP